MLMSFGSKLYIDFSKQLEISRTAAVGKTGKLLVFLLYTRAARGAISLLVVSCQHGDKKSAQATIELRSQHI